VIQRFMKPNRSSSLVVEQPGELLYMCMVEGKQSEMPRTMHRHSNCTEIVFISEGQGAHIIGGQKYATQDGDVLIYNSGTLHDESAQPSVGVVAYCCGFQGLKLRGLPANHLISAQDQPVLSSGEHYDSIKSLMQLLYDHVEVRRSADICHHLLQALIQLVNRMTVQPDAQLNILDYDLGQEVRRFIDERYADELDLQALAKRFKVSRYHLAHCFKASVGCSPIHYMIRRRMGEAQTLLINTGLSITEVAEQVGYHYPSYFNTTFKKVVGVPPSTYRKYYLGK